MNTNVNNDAPEVGMIPATIDNPKPKGRADRQDSRLTLVATQRSDVKNNVAEDDGSTLAGPPIHELEQQIRTLWNARLKTAAENKSTQESLAMTTRELEKDLSLYKGVLAKAGRNGKWSEFLRELGMPKATADRYVNRFRRRQHAEAHGNVLREEITDRQIEGWAKRCSHSIFKKLKTVEQHQKFMSLLRMELIERRSARDNTPV